MAILLSHCPIFSLNFYTAEFGKDRAEFLLWQGFEPLILWLTGQYTKLLDYCVPQLIVSITWWHFVLVAWFKSCHPATRFSFATWCAFCIVSVYTRITMEWQPTAFPSALVRHCCGHVPLPEPLWVRWTMQRSWMQLWNRWSSIPMKYLVLIAFISLITWFQNGTSRRMSVQKSFKEQTSLLI